MKIITIFFARKKQYNKLLRVWVNSLKKSMPKVNYEIIQIKKPKNIDHKRDTAFAFLAACEYALKSKEILAICDIDLMFLKDITEIEKKDFDIAITIRKKMKYNTGVWFFKPTPQAKQFLQKWIKNTQRLINNFCKNEDFCWKHGGIDQASLYLTIKKDKKTKILELPCNEWNATQSEWNTIKMHKVRIVHIKSKLRLAVFNKITIPPEHKNMNMLKNKWKEFL